VRSVPDNPEGPDSGELFRLSASGEPELVYDLGAVPLSPYWVSENALAFSPDGSQLTIVTKGDHLYAPNNGVWILDMATGEVRQVMSVSDIYKAPLDPGIPFIWKSYWAGSNLVIFTDMSGYPGGRVHYLDLTSDELTLLAHWSINEEPTPPLDGYYSTSGIVSPDGSLVLYITSEPEKPTLVLTQALPPEGDPRPLVELSPPETNMTNSLPSDDTVLRVLIGYSLLLIFQHE
jgi:hypothetical protein